MSNSFVPRSNPRPANPRTREQRTAKRTSHRVSIALVLISSTRAANWLIAAAIVSCAMVTVWAGQAPSLPSAPMHYGAFTLKFGTDGGLSLDGQGWPSFKGTWKADGDVLTLSTPMERCDGVGRYRVRLEGAHLLLTLIDDGCEPRKMILHDSRWLPDGEKPPVAARQIVRTSGDRVGNLPVAGSSKGSWPSFRGPQRVGSRRRPAPARSMERHNGREHPLAHADSRPCAFEPHRLGRPHLRHDRDQQQAERDVQAGPVRRRRRVR